MSKPPIVAVGFLTRIELERLGSQFRNHIPVTEDDVFADLLAKLDEIEVEPTPDGVALRRKS